MKVIRVCRKTILEGQKEIEAGFSCDPPTSDRVHWQLAKGLVWGKMGHQVPGNWHNWALVPVLLLITLWLQASFGCEASQDFSFFICKMRTRISVFKVCVQTPPFLQQQPRATAWRWRVEIWGWSYRWGCSWHLLMPTSGLLLGDYSLLDICLGFHSEQRTLKPAQVWKPLWSVVLNVLA